MKHIPITQAIADPNLLGGRGGLTGHSWAPWRVLLKVLFGLPLTPSELLLFHECTGRTIPPTEPFREAAIIVGRRGGKSRVLALVAVFLATLRDWNPHLAPGEQAVIAIVASDRDQARVILNYIKGFLRNKPLLKELIEDDLATIVRLNNNVCVEIHTAKISSPRGRTFACVLCDEIGFWRSESDVNPDTEVINAIRPGLGTLPGSMLIMASSPYSRRGVLWETFRKHFGRDDARTLVWKASTLTMNPALDPAIVEEAFEEDPISAAAEYGAEFRSDIDSFISREVVDRCVALGTRELMPAEATKYYAFVDPSGGSGDSFTLAIGHVDGARGVLDCIRERTPPFSPQAVVAELANDLARYKVREVQGDKYAGEWPTEEFKKHGISYIASERNKSEVYVELLPLINSCKVTLLDHNRLISQLCALERRTSRAGKDSIDHPPGAHDDVCNSAAGVLVMVAGRPPLVESWLRYKAGAEVFRQRMGWFEVPGPCMRRGRAA